MSLAQHVTQSEGFDYDAVFDDSAVVDASSIAPSDITRRTDARRSSLESWAPAPPSDTGHRTGYRRMSFNAFAPKQDAVVVEPPDQGPRVAAYKVSDGWRLAQVITGVVACLLASGIVFGFAALKPVLIAEGVYSELCAADEVRHGGDDGEAVVPCAEQDIRLNLFFVVGSITTNMASLPAGTALDRYGRRFCWTAGAIFMAIGCLLMGYSFSIPEFDGYLMGNFFLGLGGAFVFVSTYQLANAFPQHSGIVVALVTGAFDASAAVFLFYRMGYDATAGGLSLEKFFFGYLAVPALVLLAEWTFMPPHAYHYARELEEKIASAEDNALDVHDSDDDISSDGELGRVRNMRAERRRAKLDAIEDVAGDAEQREERARIREDRLGASGVWGALHGVPAHRQVFSPWFVLVLLLTVQQMLRMNQVIATIRSQYRYMLDSEALAESVNHFFDAALPIGGIASTPFIALFLNNVGVPVTFAVLTFLICLISALNCIPDLGAAYATIVAFVVFRPLYYSAISDYATKVFGFATFGRIYGALVCISGLVNFAQSGLDAWVHGPLKGNPVPVNILMGVSGTLIGGVLTAFLVVKSRAHPDEKQEPDNDDFERLPLISEEEEGYGTRHS